MSRILLLLSLAASLASAIPLDCTPGSLSSYLALPGEGCRIGQTVVSGFVDPGVLPGSTPLLANSILVNPLFDTYAEGLLFTYRANAGPGDVLESVVQFSVSALAGNHTYGSLAAGGLVATPNGVAIGSTEFCFGSYDATGTCQGASVAALVAADGVDVFPFDRKDFAPVPSFMVRHDVVLDGGSIGGASIDTAEVRFGVVPEPTTVGMFAIATFLGFLGVRSRRGGSHE